MFTIERPSFNFGIFSFDWRNLTAQRNDQLYQINIHGMPMTLSPSLVQCRRETKLIKCEVTEHQNLGEQTSLSYCDRHVHCTIFDKILLEYQELKDSYCKVRKTKRMHSESNIESSKNQMKIRFEFQSKHRRTLYVSLLTVQSSDAIQISKCSNIPWRNTRKKCVHFVIFSRLHNIWLLVFSHCCSLEGVSPIRFGCHVLMRILAIILVVIAVWPQFSRFLLHRFSASGCPHW